MAVDELWRLTTGFIKGWKKGKLKEKLQETAKIAYDEKIKNIDLEEKNRQLQDEIKRLKGEKTKPKINPANTNKDLNPKAKIPHKKKQKKDNLEIDEVIECDVDKNDLPKDATFIGQRDIVIQEMKIERRNVKFIINRYFSRELGKVIEGEVPAEFKGREFGPQLISFVIYEYYKNRVPQKKILEMLKDWGIEMSAGTLCSALNRPSMDFKDDLESAKKAAIKKSSLVYVDDTGARIMGMNGNTCGVSNEYFTQYTTSFEKNRWATVGAIFGGVQKFLINDEALSFIANKLKRARVTSTLTLLKGRSFNRFDFEEKLKKIFKFKVRKDELDIVRTGCAIAALRNKQHGPPIKFLVSDDGSNFVDIFKNHQLCWVHEIRKYKKMSIYHETQVKALEEVVKEWQGLYKKMKTFRGSLCGKLREKIRKEFDRICEIETGFSEIDSQLERTLKNKEKLLLFLKYPQLPLHSNMIETDLRERVIKRNISLQNRSMEGVRAWDLMLSLVSTCRKINLSFWRYLEDRISKREAIPYLGKVVNSL